MLHGSLRNFFIVMLFLHVIYEIILLYTIARLVKTAKLKHAFHTRIGATLQLLAQKRAGAYCTDYTMSYYNDSTQLDDTVT